MFLRPRNPNSMQASGHAAAPGPKYRAMGSDQGAALVEFAIASSIFFLLLFAVFSFALGFYTFHYVSHAAREGSRWAMVRGSACATYSSTTPCPAQESDIADYVKGLAYPGINSAEHMTVKVFTASYNTSTSTWTSCDEGVTCNAPGNQIKVVVSYDFPLNIPFWSRESITVSSTSTQIISQ